MVRYAPPSRVMIGWDFSAAQQLQIQGAVEEFRYGPEKHFCAVTRPVAVFAVAEKLVFDVSAGERLVRAAADMRLAFLQHAPVFERHADVTGERFRIRIV